jgi:hypothetical protein
MPATVFGDPPTASHPAHRDREMWRNILTSIKSETEEPVELVRSDSGATSGVARSEPGLRGHEAVARRGR